MSSRRLFSLAVLASLLLCNAALAQIKSSTITGTVTDPTGAVVAGAEVTVTEAETNFAQTVTTNGEGEFTVPYLAAGRYSVTVKKTGFSTVRKIDLQLGTAQSVRADVALQAGQVESTVEVTAEAAQLQTESATVQNSINEATIKTVPNINHNPFYYAALQPGVVGRASFNDTTNINSFGIGVDGRRFFSAISVNGAQAFSSDIQVDGLSVQGSAWNEAAIIPNSEGLQEVKTITNSYSAEYGRGSGVISLMTKSGTNDYHGSAIYRARNEALNANTFDNNARGIRRAPFKVHSYTASLGGPVWIPKIINGRDRLFFFTSYEGLRHTRALDFFRTVPTERERRGDFSQTRVLVNGVATPLQIFDPRTATPVAGQPNLFRRNLIPNADLSAIPGLVDPNIQRLFAAYPLPNRTPDDPVTQANNYYARRGQSFDRNSINARVDAKLGQHSIYSSFGVNRGAITTPGAWGPENPFYNQFQFIGESNSDRNPYGQVGGTFVITPRVFADIRYGLARIFTVNKAYPNETNFDYSPYGIPASILSINAVPNAAPEFGPGGNLAPLSRTSSLYKEEGQTNHNVTGSVTWQVSRWTIKGGGEFRVYLSNYDDPAFAFSIPSRADLTREYVNNFGTGQNPLGGTLTAANSGWQPASILMGYGRIQVEGGRNPKPAFAQKYLAFWTQNEWRATERLNISLGLRYDIQPGVTDRFNRLRSLNLEKTNAFGMRGEWVFPGYQGVNRNLYETSYDNFGPRFGFAYRVRENTVVRGGYGLTYLPSNTGFFATGGFYGMDAFAFSTLNDDSVIFGNTPQGVPVGRFNQVNVIVPPIGADPRAPQYYGNSNFAYFTHNDYKNAYQQQWNLTLEHRFARSWLASVGYVGSKGTHLPVSRVPYNNNQFVSRAQLDACRANYIARNGTGTICNDPVPNPFQTTPGTTIPFGGNLRNATLPLIQTLQPFPSIAGSGIVSTFGWSNYHSLQTSITRQFGNGLQFNANYVWSKALGLDASESQTNGFSDGGVGYNGGQFDLRQLSRNNSLLSTDVPHRFVFSFVYELPFGAGKLIDGGKVVNALIGGWRTGGAYNAQSGTPIVLGGAATGSLNGRSNRVPGVDLEVPQELQRWYNGASAAERTVKLPSGRTITVCRFCFLKYNADAFRGQVVQLANSNYVTDLYWDGTAALTYGDLRQPGLNNFNFSLDRDFKLRERLQLQFSMQATNFFNKTQFRPTINGGLGNTNAPTVAQQQQGFIPGLGTNDSFGTFTTATFDPRQIELQLRIRF